MDAFAPELCHGPLLGAAPRALGYDRQRDFDPWRREVAATLRTLVGKPPEPVALTTHIEFERETDLFRETRFVFASEPGADVPCHLLVPRNGRAPFPVVICLQGHSTGMHISLGRPKFEGDAQLIGGERDFALQAVREGYAALALEQRCFGERENPRPHEGGQSDRRCRRATMVALMLGRTMIGERVWDVSRAIDALASFPEVDTSRIGCMGNSGGGTTTYFAACLDGRISVAMPSCYVCTFGASLGSIEHCECNFIPDIMRYFEMGDLAALIAPRPLVVVAGRADPIFPFSGVQETFETIQQIYAAAGAPGRCRLVVGEGGHRFYAGPAWPVFRELAAWQV